MSRVLVACECSGRVRDAFIKEGHDAMSCDLLPTMSPGPHYQGDIFDLLAADSDWDLMIAHPPCTYLSSSGIHWNNRGRGWADTNAALQLEKKLDSLNIPHIAIENPVGILSTRLRKPSQYIQPWQYGHPESKKTCLWLKNLPLLVPTHILTPTQFTIKGTPQWDNQTSSGQNKIGPSAHRDMIRSLTYQGWADAMASQWGPVI